MQMAFIVCNSYFNDRVMKLLAASGIDYYTAWDHARGKGHGTEPHLGSGQFASTNSVTMVAFEDEKPLEVLAGAIAEANREILRPADRVRLFALPLARVV